MDDGWRMVDDGWCMMDDGWWTMLEGGRTCDGYANIHIRCMPVQCIVGCGLPLLTCSSLNSFYAKRLRRISIASSIMSMPKHMKLW